MRSLFLQNLNEKYSYYYDIKQQPSFIPFPLDLYAHFYQQDKRYFASKNLNLWTLEHEEHCLVKCYESLTIEDFDNMTTVLKNCITQLVKPGPDHMKTFITGVLASFSPISSHLKQSARLFNHSQAFKCYFYGWCDLRLILLDVHNSEITSNKAGKEMECFYKNLLSDTNNKKKELHL